MQSGRYSLIYVSLSIMNAPISPGVSSPESEMRFTSTIQPSGYNDSFKKVEAVLARVQAIRDAVGMDMEFGIDFHGRVHKSMAKVLAKGI